MFLAGDNVPDYFLCPITGCLMRQPAMTPDGVTYDYDAIVEWCANSRAAAAPPPPTAADPPPAPSPRRLQTKQTDPSTNQPLTPDSLCPNRTVRSMIEDFIAKGPDFLFAK